MLKKTETFGIVTNLGFNNELLNNETVGEEWATDHVQEWTSAGTTVYPASSVTLINIPEPVKVSGKFSYNFYTRDERTSGGGERAIINVGAPSQEQNYQARKGSMPRSIVMNITPAYFNSDDGMLKRIKSSLGRSPIDSNLNSMHFEGAMSSGMFASMRLQDNQIDQSFYYALSSSVSFFGIDDSTSGTSQAESISSHISASSAFSPNGEAIREAMSNMQAQGVSYAPTDVRQEIASTAMEDIRFVNFSQSINSLLVSNIVNASIEDKTNIFEDEIESVTGTASVLQTKALSLSNPGSIDASEYRIAVNSIWQKILPANASTVSKFNEASLPIGFYIEKKELIQNLDGSWQTVEHSPIILNQYPESAAEIEIIDPDVKYGAVYVYNVRTVVLTRFEALIRDNDGPIEDQMGIVVIMVGSEGQTIKVECTESIPPPPPGNLSFKYDYQNDNLLLFWEEGSNPQRDVVRYQIFRRKSIETPFQLISEYDFDMSTSKVIPVEKAPKSLVVKMSGARKLFRDTDFNKDSEFIYAIASSDARGFTSGYSSQHMVSFSLEKNKIQTKLVSKQGAPKPYPNIYLNQDLFVDTMKDSGHTRLRIFFDPEYYDVYETILSGNSTNKASKSGKKNESKSKIQKRVKNSLNLIGNNYKLQIINVDRQLSKKIDIDISDQSGEPIEIPLNQATLTSVANIASNILS